MKGDNMSKVENKAKQNKAESVINSVKNNLTSNTKGNKTMKKNTNKVKTISESRAKQLSKDITLLNDVNNKDIKLFIIVNGKNEILTNVKNITKLHKDKLTNDTKLSYYVEYTKEYKAEQRAEQSKAEQLKEIEKELQIHEKESISEIDNSIESEKEKKKNATKEIKSLKIVMLNKVKSERNTLKEQYPKFTNKQIADQLRADTKDVKNENIREIIISQYELNISLNLTYSDAKLQFIIDNVKNGKISKADTKDVKKLEQKIESIKAELDRAKTLEKAIKLNLIKQRFMVNWSAFNRVL